MDKDTGEGKKPVIKKVISYDYETPLRDDEIDLVDLWIFFWDRRKLFLISAMLVAFVGIAGFELLYAPKQVDTVRSLLETRDISVDTGSRASEYLAAYVERLKIIDLPRFASAQEFSQISTYILDSSIIVMKDTDFIEIVTETPASAAVDVTRFHNELTGMMASEIESSLHSQLYVRIASIDRGIERLRAKLVALQQGVTSEAASQTFSSYPTQDYINPKLEDMLTQIEDMAEDLDVVTGSLQNFTPRVLVAASVTEKSTGIKKSVAYSLIVVLAIFLGIFVVIGSAFVARVRERMASRS
jgi:hypothetical protein